MYLLQWQNATQLSLTYFHFQRCEFEKEILQFQDVHCYLQAKTRLNLELLREGN